MHPDKNHDLKFSCDSHSEDEIKNDCSNPPQLLLNYSPTSMEELMDDITTEMAIKRLSRSQVTVRNVRSGSEYSEPLRIAPRVQLDDTGRNAISDASLNSSLVRKNSQLLEENMEKDKIIKKQQECIKSLRDRLQVYQASGLDGCKSNADRIEILEKCCEKLQKQIFEMEEFLHDHGLVWVGNQPAKSTVCVNRNDGMIDNKIFDLIVSRIESLNRWIGLDEAKVIRNPDSPNMACLKRQDPIPLTLYSDGICVYSGPFRPYKQHSTLQFIQDILDGYFPSELEPRYPNGVPIQLTDNRTISFMKTWQEKNATVASNNKGCKLGTSEQPVKTPSNKELFSSFESTSKKEYGYREPSQVECDEIKRTNTSDLLNAIGLYPCTSKEPLTMNDLIKSLPEHTITKSGRLVSVRDDLKTRFTSQPCAAVKYVDINASKLSENRDHHIEQQKEESSCSSQQHSEISLKIRSEDGSEIYNLLMSASDTVEQIYKYINKARPGRTNSNYRLVTMGPSRLPDQTTNKSQPGGGPYYRQALVNMSQKLGDAGLSQRTMLRMEPLPPKYKDDRMKPTCSNDQTK